MNVLITFLSLVCLFFVVSAAAEIKSEAISNKIEVTEGQQLMTQVDIVSLYFSTSGISYEPHAIFDGRMKIDVVVLDSSIVEDSKQIEDFISRQTSVFGKELARRLKTAAPSIAANFDPNRDLIFIISGGVERKHMADVVDGKWKWLVKMEKGDKGKVCNKCPSLRD